MFGPGGIVISSLVGPVSFNTKGLVLKDYGTIPSAATGSIALINNELKFNTDGTIGGWKLPAGEGIWKDENFPKGFLLNILFIFSFVYLVDIIFIYLYLNATRGLIFAAL